MPELPEVHTTATGLNKVLKGLSIRDVWTNYNSSFHSGKDNIKNPRFFETFREKVIGAKVIGASRRAKNVLIHLKKPGKDEHTILVHMKMTGHILYGEYAKTGEKKDPWRAVSDPALCDDPFNRHVRLIFMLSNGNHVALSDMRRFAKVTLIPTKELEKSADLSELGPEPLEKNFTLEKFKERLAKKPNGKIKQVLMDQTVIAGIGNIYSDEMLWKADIHPESKPRAIPSPFLVKLFKAMKEVLVKGIDFGGDSMSDYRNVYGERGKFQHKHNAYRLTGKPCGKRGCKGVIKRKVIGGRSAHFCSVHQKLFE